MPLDLVEATTGKVWSVSEIQKSLTEGNRFVVLGDYGSGKSMTLREMFRGLRAEYLKDRAATFPLYLNLRDHFGQTNPAEVLERHARNIGFPHPSHLVRAWRAGYVVLLIDGFDELATLGIQGLWKRLQDVRFRAMAAVRQFIKEQPLTAGIVIAGRAHFFDSAKERRSALYPTSNFIEFALNEFNDEQIQRYLSKQGLAGNVPDWIPSRPLLVGYLAASGVLKEAIAELSSGSDDGASDPAQGWDYIVDRVCDRESDIDIGIDGPTVRKMLERLATIARQSQSGLGPLSPENITTAFTDVCGYQPDEKGALLLQRLPGLGIDRDDEGTRIFLDEDFADVCRAGDVVAHICDPFGSTLEQFRGVDRSIGSLGVGVVLLKTSGMSLNSGKMQPAIQQALTNDELSSVVLDLVRVSMESKVGIGIPIRLNGILVHSLELSSDAGDLSMLTFSECLFSYLAIDAEVDVSVLPRFRGCYVDEVDGRSSSKDLPEGIFDKNCEFGHFAEAPETTRAIVAMDLPVGAKVLLTVLKKLYERKGSGRKENALHRGLDHHSRRFVSSVLRLLQTEGIVSSYKRGGMDMNIWIPDRSKMTRVQKLLASPRTCGDVLIQRASDLD